MKARFFVTISHVLTFLSGSRVDRPAVVIADDTLRRKLTGKRQRYSKELGFVDAAQEIEVERVGNTLVLRLVTHETLADIGKIFSMFSPNFMAEGREFQEEHERDWENIFPLLAKARD